MGLWVFLRRRSSLAYYLTLGLLSVISLLTLTDDFGLSDLIVLIITIAPFVLLIKDRGWYLERYPSSSE
jgi:predicted membrane channel-forming protein YqfA (hemolysin III family)